MDYRRTRSGRRRSWYGLKRHVKRLLAMRLPHAVLRGAVRLRPELRRGGRLPAPAHLREIEGEAGETRFVMLNPDRCIVAKELYWGEGRRPSPADQLAIEIFAAAARRAGTALDIGAYTGLFTVVAARSNPAIHVHAFEIVPENFRALFDNCVRNDVLGRVTLHHVGVGAPDTVIRVPARTSGSALPDFYSSEMRFDSGVGVRLVSLDSLVGTLEPQVPAIVKIDVEGTEAEVLRHGREFLSSLRPLILCEVLPGADGAELAPLLEAYGYSFHLVRDHDVLRRDRIEPDEGFRDWLFVPGDADRELAGLGIPAVSARGPALARQ
jgi:FkbM family methyltransferase